MIIHIELYDGGPFGWAAKVPGEVGLEATGPTPETAIIAAKVLALGEIAESISSGRYPAPTVISFTVHSPVTKHEMPPGAIPMSLGTRIPVMAAPSEPKSEGPKQE